MRRITIGALALAFLTVGPASIAASSASAGQPPPERNCVVDVGTKTETIDFEGAPRTYRVATPSRPGTGSLPLILNFHGFGSNAIQQAVYSQLEEKGPARGYVVITPEGTGSRAFWNILPNLAKPDDVAYAGTLIDAADEHACIDPNRVYSTGMSNGAGLSALLGCTLGKRIAAIAPVAGVNLVDPCPRGKPVSVIAFHGQADAVVKYDGGPPAVGATGLDLVPVEDAVAGFAKRDGCRLRPAEKSISDAVERTTFRGCRDGSAVVLYSVSDAGHTWPGSLDVPRLGHVTPDINAADLILDFFDQHPQRAKTAR